MTDPEIRERIAKALNTDGAWCGDCDFEGCASCSLCRRTCLGYADAVLAVLDRETLIGLLGAEQVGYWDGEFNDGQGWLWHDGNGLELSEVVAVYRFPAEEDQP